MKHRSKGWAGRAARAVALCAAAGWLFSACEVLDWARGDKAVLVVENGGAVTVDIYLNNALLGPAPGLAATTWTIPAGTHVVRGDGRGASPPDYNPGPCTFEAHGGEQWHWHIGDFTGTPYLDVY
jgi:hypothetical protein